MAKASLAELVRYCDRTLRTDQTYQILRRLIENNLAIYSSHLPLDMHPRLGNNVALCAALGLRATNPFFYQKEQYLGLQARTRVSRDELTARLQKAVGGTPT